MAGGTGLTQPMTAVARPGDFAYDPQAQITGVSPGIKNGFGDTFGATPLQPNIVTNTPGAGVPAFIKAMGGTLADGNISADMQGQGQQGQPGQMQQEMSRIPQQNPNLFDNSSRPSSMNNLGAGKGGAGGQPAMPTARPPQGQYAPMAPQGQFNVNQASAGALQQAMQGTQAGMGFQAQNVRPTGYQAQAAQSTGYRPSSMGSLGYGASTIGQTPTVSAQNVYAGQLSNSNLGAYTNPYEDQVVQQTLSDISGAQEKSLNQMGAQATAAKAFGGSRQGIAEAETRKGFAEQAAQAVSGLRQAGFTQAQQMAQQDIGTAQQAALANQQANLQAGTTTAGFGQQTNLSNQAVINAASQFGSSAANQAAAANMAAQNQAAQFGSSAANQMALANQGAFNQAGQFGATQGMSAQLANQQAQMQANNARMAAAAQMAGLGQQAFNTGQTIQGNQQQQGLLQQSIQQALIDAARQQYAGYTGAPQTALQAPLQALGIAQQGGASTTTKSGQPGLLSYLQAASGFMPK